MDARFYAMESNFAASLCAMEATHHSASRNMVGQVKACILEVQSVLIAVIKDPDSASAVTLHSAIYALEHKLTDTINSVLLPDANEPASSSAPDNTDADAMCPAQGHKKKKRKKKKKKKSKISTQPIEAEPTSLPAHEAVEDDTSDSTLLIDQDISSSDTSDSTSLIVNDIISSEPSENVVLAEEAVLNSSVHLAVSKATLAT